MLGIMPSSWLLPAFCFLNHSFWWVLMIHRRIFPSVRFKALGPLEACYCKGRTSIEQWFAALMITVLRQLLLQSNT